MNKNLIIESYGIRLVRLTEEKIELVRQWRNNPKISQYMEYREYITVDMQKKWFKKISNDNNFFFLVVVNNKEIGLVDIKDIDYVRNCGESGIFLWDDSFLGKQISYRSLLALHDFAFDTLHLSLLISHILDNNVRSQKSYMSLGFVLNEKLEGVRLQKYTLTREEHERARLNIINKLKPLIIS